MVETVRSVRASASASACANAARLSEASRRSKGEMGAELRTLSYRTASTSLRLNLCQPPREESALRLVRDERQRSPISLSGIRPKPKTAQKVSAGCRVKVITCKFFARLELIQQAKSCGRTRRASRRESCNNISARRARASICSGINSQTTLARRIASSQRSRRINCREVA